MTDCDCAVCAGQIDDPQDPDEDERAELARIAENKLNARIAQIEDQRGY